MATSSDAVFIDSNVLIYASAPASPHHAAAMAALDRIEAQGVPLWISTQVVREFLAQTTRPDVLAGRPLVEAVARAPKLYERFYVAPETEVVGEVLLDLVERHGVRGKRVHDANIAATCVAYGVGRLLTHNGADFARYAPAIEVVPL